MQIYNASKRTDLPAFYAQELATKMLDNPNDFFILWTKNIIPLFKTNVLSKHKNWYIQHTLTPYATDIEQVDKSEIAHAVEIISKMYGKNRIVLRYDPILLTSNITMEYHKFAFKRYIERFSNAVDTVVISFLDYYSNMPKHLKSPNILQRQELIEYFASIAGNVRITTCAENTTLPKSQCVDPKRIEDISGNVISNHKSALQRKLCSCIKAQDIGSYMHKCKHKCLYCYAKHG